MAAVEPGRMPRTLTIDERDLERALLRKSVGVLADERRRCADCSRTPLIGELVYRYDGGTVVCELCRVLRPGEPSGRETVRHSEHGLAVRVHRS